MRRGSRIYVEGRLEYGAYDREGVSIPTADVIVQEFVMLDGKNGAGEFAHALDESENDQLD